MKEAFPRVDIQGEENLVPGANCTVGVGELPGNVPLNVV